VRRILRCALVVSVLAWTAAPALLRADDPPPWEAGGDAPSWESGDVPLPPEEGEGAPAGEEAAEEPDLAPPGEDTERPYRGATADLEETSLNELGLEVVERQEVSWLAIPFDARGPVFYGAAGFEAGGGLGHIVITGAAGYTVAGEWQALRADGRPPRLLGRATNVMLSVDMAPGVTADAAASFITVGVRGQQVFAFGEHMLNLQLGLGGRADLGTSLGGVDLAFGIGYANVRAPFAIPFQLEVVRHFAGVFGRQWGARLSIGWPLWL
jgi:hypothetical protein